ncbi:branched-chain amino acid ABC transporter permease [Micromonospora sp. MA102]|uniref:branched-chain amino acid ABC transporter permease n=1 Tax=Micromonospora sp. MA102 TaxID=2952755 RepID=UPI0021C7C74D|nr:branched-chain amino acid ABC transporter permease [Micromonospora sp. MA102]
MSAPALAGRRSAWDTRRTVVAAAYTVAAVIAVVLPFTSPPYVVQNYTRVLIVALPAIGLNMLTGYAGLISLGQSAFFGLGAYVTAILAGDHGWAWWETTPLAMLLAFGAGMLVGVPSLRIKGIYLAVVTLVLAAFFPSIIMRFNHLTGGNQGKTLDVMEAPSWLPFESDQFGYFVCALILVVVMVLMHNLARSRAGRSLVALRDNQTAAAMMGVDRARTNIAIFGVSASLAGLAGSLFSATQGIVSSETAYLTLGGSIQFIAAMVLGGPTTVVGPLVGSAITERLPVVLSGIDPVLAQVIYGALLIVVVLLMRGGIGGVASRLLNRILRRYTSRRRESAPGVVIQPREIE